MAAQKYGPEHRRQARSVTFVVLVILAVVWAVYLVSWVRSRTEHRRVNSINSFSQHLSILERTAPGSRGGRSQTSVAASFPGTASFAPRRPTMSQTKKRRRDVLVGLLAATGVTFLGMLVMGGMLTYLFGLSLVLTVAYVMALANLQKRALERRSKVRYLDGAAVTPTAWVGTDTDDAEAADYGYPVGRVYAVNGR